MKFSLSRTRGSEKERGHVLLKDTTTPIKKTRKQKPCRDSETTSTSPFHVPFALISLPSYLPPPPLSSPTLSAAFILREHEHEKCDVLSSREHHMERRERGTGSGDPTQGLPWLEVEWQAWRWRGRRGNVLGVFLFSGGVLWRSWPLGVQQVNGEAESHAPHPAPSLTFSLALSTDSSYKS